MKHPMHRRTFCLTMLSSGMLPTAVWAQTAAPLEIGVLPNISARTLLAQYQPMREYLVREMKRSVQISTAPDWPSFHRRTLGLEYDLVVTAANLARVAQIDRGYVPLLIYAPNIKGLVISATTAPIRSVAELKGQTLALSNPQSLVALRGMQWLAENGLQRDKDFKVVNTRADDSVGSVVLRGDAIAAMLSGGEFRAIPEAIRGQLQVLTVFAEVAGFVALASPRLRAIEVNSLKEHLKNFATTSDESKTFFSSSGFTGMRDLPSGWMESMDNYLEATRRALSPAG
ncbi:MAG: PhnD/SsuA/transferrin family substrate-binding protein [Burkholderiaceae bacterium]|nr:PhnD/SsuA/transferrin family substrate-binding protein [Burkholderiaceae bacterium]